VWCERQLGHRARWIWYRLFSMKARAPSRLRVVSPLTCSQDNLRRSKGSKKVILPHRFIIPLTRIIHERFYCNRGFAAATSLDAVGPASRQAGSPLGRSTYCFKYASLPYGSAPACRQTGACLAWRLRDFVTNRHE
jgi:hypothetical protein